MLENSAALDVRRAQTEPAIFHPAAGRSDRRRPIQHCLVVALAQKARRHAGGVCLILGETRSEGSERSQLRRRLAIGALAATEVAEDDPLPVVRHDQLDVGAVHPEGLLPASAEARERPQGDDVLV